MREQLGATPQLINCTPHPSPLNWNPDVRFPRGYPRARECSALASLGETVVRTATGYVATSGRLVCMDCFVDGKQHLYNPDEEPHASHR